MRVGLGVCFVFIFKNISIIWILLLAFGLVSSGFYFKLDVDRFRKEFFVFLE